MSEATTAPKKITILGGGIAAMTCAFEITSDPDWRRHYDLTVYQLGWRLGGKGASGRNAAQHDRIEEHGLHILLGFYDNAFRVLKACYDELGRPPGAPLATWRDAFKPHDYVVLTEQVGDRWDPWVMNFPPNTDEPGTGGVLPTPWALIEMTLGWLRQLLAGAVGLEGVSSSHPALDAAHAHTGAGVGGHLAVVRALLELRTWLHGLADRIEAELDLRRLFVTVDLAIAAIKGMIEDGVIFPPYDWFALDGLDFRAWLSKHGAHQVSVDSAYIRGMYDLGFSLDGQVGAGTALNGILRMCWTYKGAVFWKMQAGMGDTIFGPLYEVLRRRGVRFSFFHRVDALLPSDDGTAVERIVVGRQATVRGGGEYQPLVDVLGLPCWPSEPDFAQLVEGEALRASGTNLEDWWTPWQDPVPPLELVRGRDFDQVVLACSLGVFPYICPELIKRSPPLAAMVAHVGTTQTQAAQLWLSPDLAGLGWDKPSPVLDGYAEPLDTWADMTHLLPRERWPAPDAGGPRNLAYLCSPLPDDEPMPPRSDHGYAQRQDARVRAHVEQWLDTEVGALWPKATRADNPRGLDWDLLVAPGQAARGPARIDTQYWLATLNPSDRYVLALPGSVGFRLHTDGAGFSNLFLAGDYIRTGMNVGCVEAATMGGLHASRAICGRPAQIIGDST
ncbi:MAG: NAD(P)-binding protein [Kofleriaceae bacterium]|nr:NAD(P)-binding protein [Kofleriaceae bacterium]